MDLSFLHDVVTHTGPLAVAHVSETRSDQTGEHEQELHNQAALERLRRAGATEEAVAAVASRVGGMTGEAGEQARHVVATADGEVLLDLVVPHQLEEESVSWGPVPSLLPLLRGLDPAVAHILVVADSTGADITVVDPLGRQVGEMAVDGDHDVLHKFKGGGWSHRRFQQRVQDSYERNADVVVERLTHLIDRHHPEVVVVGGDVHARTLVQDGLRAELRDRVRVVEGLGRADGVHAASAAAEVEQVLREVRLSRMATVVADLQRGLGQGTLAATGRTQVVAAARLASVRTLLLLSDDESTGDGGSGVPGPDDAGPGDPGPGDPGAGAPRPDDRPTLWASADPLLVGTTAREVADLGGEPFEAPATDVLVRAVAAQGGAVELVDGVHGVLRHGVGAVLRFDVRPETPRG